MVTTLYLVRHCQAEGNLMMAYHGQTDGKVTEMGKLQLEAVAKASTDWALSAIYTSPLQRAFQTAEAVNRNYDLPLIIDNDLMEIYCGEWEGKDWEYIFEHYNESYVTWELEPEKFVSPGGESMVEAYERICKAINTKVRAHPGKTVAVVGHSAVFRCYLAYVLYGELRDLKAIGWGDNTNICKVEFDENFDPTLCYKYDASHLTPEISTTELRKRLGIRRPKALRE